MNKFKNADFDIGNQSDKFKLLSKLESEKLHKVMPAILLFAEKQNDSALKNFCFNELYGYGYKRNLPEYRRIPVIYYDKNGEKISQKKIGDVLSIQDLFHRDHYSFLGTIESLENMTIDSDSRSFIALKKPLKIKIENRIYEAHSYEYFANEIKSSIIKLKKKLLIMLSSIESKEVGGDLNFINFLHPEIKSTCLELLKNGHYRQAVLDASIGLVEKVKDKSGLFELDNTSLMQRAFSVHNPIIKISNDSDEQLGYMWLFSGAIMAMRNKNAHKLGGVDSFEECLESLFLISRLYRILEER